MMILDGHCPMSIGEVRTRVRGSLAESESSQVSESSSQLNTAALPQKPESITGSTNIGLVDQLGFALPSFLKEI